jgi:hypothetical protein
MRPARTLSCGLTDSSGSSAGFQAMTMMRRESGRVRIVSTASATWSMVSPSAAGQARHWRP